MSSSAPFCPCTDGNCEFNPMNHDKGCTLCVEDSIQCEEIPKCFFKQAGGDIDTITDWSFENFANVVLKK
jgi:hypothetical protein